MGSILQIPLNAKEANKNRVSDTLMETLCKKLNSGQGCNADGNSILLAGYTFKDNEEMLLLFTLYKINAMYHEGFQNISVLVDRNGQWHISNNELREVFVDMQLDPHGRVWVETTYPSEFESLIYYSIDGLNWHNVQVSHGSHDMCMLPNQLLLTSPYATVASYSDLLNVTHSDYNTISLWKKLDDKVAKQKKCLTPKAKNNHWKSIQKDKFINTKTSAKIDVSMYELRGQYTVQLGVFYDINSINRSWFSINTDHDTYYPIIIKKMQTPKGIVYKVFLDTFFEKDDAKKAMKIVLSQSIFDVKEAFVTEFPKEGEIVPMDEIKKSW